MLTTPKNSCYGCTACCEACGSDALSMQPDSEGFLYPVLDIERCVHCDLCNKICPAQHVIEDRDVQPRCLATWNKDDAIRYQSSSGGVFTALAQEILTLGGVVCGAAYDQDRIRHIIIDNADELARLRGSKYVQSDLEHCFPEIRSLLRKKRYVFFTGTPCQVAGLRGYLRRDSEYLLTADVVCHGVPSPKVWEKYVEYLMGKEPLTSVHFRSKINGWNNFHIELGSASKQYKKRFPEDLFMKGFLHDLYLRPSCSRCSFTTIPRQGDISLGDFWGIAQYAPSLDDDKGTSLILINSEKAQRYFSRISDQMARIQEVPLNFARTHNPVLTRPCKPHANRAWFFKQLDNPRFHFERDLNSTLKGGAEVGILNMWWGLNYGGNLTGLALQRKVAEMGYSNRLIYYTQGRPSEEEYEASVFAQFAKEQMQTTSLYKGVNSLRQTNMLFDTFIVGSDQVWRYEYTRDARLAYFFSFVQPTKKLIAMAASFGVSEWEWPDSEKHTLQAHISRFDAISVRERDGVELCDQHLDVSAEWVMDPVFFYDAAWWSELADRDAETLPECFIACYVLDNKDDIKSHLGDNCKHPLIDAATREGAEATVYAWLRTIRDCSSLITDSFHGVCFALIFRKPFVVFANRDRGYSRFSSLLSLVGMKHRIVQPNQHDSWKEMLNESLDEQRLVADLQPMLLQSEDFLMKALLMKCKNNRADYATFVALSNQAELNKLKVFLLNIHIKKYKLLIAISRGARKVKYQKTLSYLLHEIDNI